MKTLNSTPEFNLSAFDVALTQPHPLFFSKYYLKLDIIIDLLIVTLSTKPS